MTDRTGVHKKGKITVLDVINASRNKSDFLKAGALGLFIGVVRGETLKGEKVQKLELEAYEEKANEVLTNICNSLKKRRGIVDVQIHHFLGEFEVGEDLVYVLVAADHRKNLFPVLEEAVEQYKQKAPIFKKEYATSKEGKELTYWTSEEESHKDS
jgi:molybdopterin synthase catalytic subunit